MATAYSTYYLGAVASLKFLAVENMPPPLFGPCLLWSNGWMEQDTTWYGVRPRPRWQCARLGPTSPTGTGTAAPHFSAHAYCDQTAGWIRIPLGTEVRLRPGDIVLDGDLAPPPRKGAQQPPTFQPTALACILTGPHFTHNPYCRLGIARRVAVMAILPDDCHPSSLYLP